MPHYDFRKDLPVATQTEKEIAEKMVSMYGFEIVSFCNTGDYDVLLKKGDKAIIVEIKEDFTCERTGNVGVEFECRGKPSGVQVSKSTHYIYKVHSQKDGIVYLAIKTSKLKEIIANGEYHRIVNGGDVGSNSMNYLFAYDKFREHAEELFANK